MEILRVYQTKNPSYTRNRSIDPVGILVHSTGANNPNCKRYVDAEEYLGKNQYGNHWNKTSATKSVHAFIGYDKDKNVVVAQTLPYDRACWGAGKGNKGSANYNPQARLQFEICQSSATDADYYWKAIAVAEEYCAHLCVLFGWTVDNITSHKEAHANGYASNHGDPQSWMRNFGDNMDKFRERVAMRLKGKNPPENTVEKEIKQESTETEKASENAVSVQNSNTGEVLAMKTIKNGSKGTQVKVLQWLLNDAGYKCGEADGICGSKTVAAVKAYQKAKGLEADGICGKKTWNALLK